MKTFINGKSLILAGRKPVGEIPVRGDIYIKQCPRPAPVESWEEKFKANMIEMRKALKLA
ncbi:MAG: hypothetical protein ACM3TR_19965 [Caulobacteraceae bacterium]